MPEPITEEEARHLRGALRSNAPISWPVYMDELNRYIAAGDYDAATGLIWDATEDEATE